jgi:hypothetical protein
MSELHDNGKIKRQRLGNPQRCVPGTIGDPEFCPTLSHVAEPEVVLPGVASRVLVLEIIQSHRSQRAHPTQREKPRWLPPAGFFQFASG